MPPSKNSPKRRPRLLAITGPHEGASFRIDLDPFSVGRHPSNSLQIRRSSVSRRHCRLTLQGDGYELEDLKSRHGTFLNGAPILKANINHGDFIRVADSLFRFLSDGEPEVEEDRPLYSGGYSAQTTFEMRPDDSRFLHPYKIAEDPDSKTDVLQTLLAISRSVQGSDSLESLAASLTALILKIVPAQRVAVILGEERSVVHQSHRSGRAHSGEISRTIVEEVWQRKKAIQCNDVFQAPAFQDSESLQGAHIQSLLCAPMTVHDSGPLGVLYADTREKGVDFQTDHFELMAAVGAIAAPAFHNMIRLQRLEGENRRLRQGDLEHDMIGSSPGMKRVLRLIAAVAPTDCSVLIQGESGTGKELAALALHVNSPRADSPFVDINCANLSDNLLESELFGHEKGAFTGAAAQKLGKFEIADTGTVFLDEVGELPVPLQARLLRVLERREFTRLGGTRNIQVDIRLVAATNRDLERAVRDGDFRQDLYYRLNVVNLVLPPLRERRPDVIPLASHFLRRYSRRLNRPLPTLSPNCKAHLMAHDWPGNVRELENAMQRALVLGHGDQIRVKDLPTSGRGPAPGPSGEAGSYHQELDTLKRQLILDAFEEAQCRYKDAAKRLGLTPNYLHRLIRNLDMKESLRALQSEYDAR